MEKKGNLDKMKYFPLLTSKNSIGKELSNDEYNDVWKVFYSLPEETKGILTAPEMPQNIEALQKERGLLDDHIEIVSASIREYFVFKKDALWLENALMAKLDKKDVASVKEYIQKNILTIKPAPKAPEEDEGISTAPQTASLPLLDAMAKYQRLSEQNITEDRITVKGESQPVRGSLRNWIRHYRDNMGIRKHSAVERGQFLFQGENTRRLGVPEREKLSVVFRSLEENTPISIDVERQEIIFPEFSENTVKAVESSEQKNVKESPALGTTFRPLEKFPAKQAPIRKALEWEAPNVPKNAPKIPPLPVSSSVTQKPLPEPGKARVVGVSAPVYAFPSAPTPAQKPIAEPSSSVPESIPTLTSRPGSESIKHDTTPLPASPFAAPGSISFSSSHVLPGEKDVPKEDNQPISKSVPSEPEAISIIKPRGNGFGFRGATPSSEKPEK